MVHSEHHRPRRRQRGTTLVESLVACVFAAIAAVGAGQAAQQLRQHGDLARQRSEALRLADAALEGARGAMAAASNTARALDADAHDVAGGNARYRVTRAVASGARHADVDLGVAWNDRTGAEHSIRLATTLARQDPAYSAALALGAGSPTLALPYARATAVPPGAVSIGGGRSVWRPAPGAAHDGAIVFDDATGDVVALCDDGARPPQERGASLAGCTRVHAVVASGTVRVDGGALPSGASLSPGLALEGAGYPAAPMCSSDAMKTVRLPADGGALRLASVAADATPAALGVASWLDTGERFVAWRCVVQTAADGAWSGRLDLAGVGGRRICAAAGGEASLAWRDFRTSRTDLDLRVAAPALGCAA